MRVNCVVSQPETNEIRSNWGGLPTTLPFGVTSTEMTVIHLTCFPLMNSECSSSLLPMKKVRMLASLPMIAVFTMQF